MAENKDKSNELKSHANRSGEASGARQREGKTGPVAGSANNTRGENKPSREGSGRGAKPGKGSASPDTPKGSTPERGG
ncbi:MAG: hypothetical protein LPK07_03035 [Hymenobacteraceae bacterium]|nr:hypothetical protein [Hymenobacteraceae bacterium]MDX5480634.1 hypothetical protein [Hymenobacteraceae bacterium]